MPELRSDPGEERVLVIAPTGRDRDVVTEILARHQIQAEGLVDVQALRTESTAGVGAIFIAEEALQTGGLEGVSQALEAQPTWSDIPLIVSTARGATTDAQVRLMASLKASGNVSVLERPVRVLTMVTTVQTALRSRRRQYAMRDLLKAQQAHLEELAAERALRAEQGRQSELQFRSIADSIPQLAWMTDSDGYIVWYNQRWYEYTGTVFEEMKGWGWKAVHDPADLERVTTTWTSSLASGQPWQDEFRLRGKDGTFRWFLSRALPVRDSAGRIVRWFGTNTDIDAQKRADAERVQLAEEARRRAEFQEQLIAIVGHDLRNPLWAILMSTRVLSRYLTEDPPRTTLERIVAGANRATRIIEELLDLTQARLGGGIPISPQAVQLHDVVQQVVEEHRASHPGRTVLFTSRGEGAGIWDSGRLAQVVANLVSNALHYSPVDASVEVHSDGTDQNQVSIRVHNGGDPIPPALLPQLFEPYKRGQSDRARKSLGLGLFIVERLVTAHGGTVEVQSTPSEGTTLWVRLPRAPLVAALPVTCP